MLLHTPFERQAEQAPDRVAIGLGDRTLSYGRLNRQADLLAAELRARGVGAGTVVGVCAQRSLELVIACLAALKAGAAYLPLDPSYPRRRLLELLDDAAPPVLLADAPARDSIGREAVAGTLDLETVAWLAPAEAAPVNGPAKVDPDDLAYVIYTSGSTGRPKGVMSTHRGIANRLEWMQGRYRLTRSDRVLHKTSIGFDVSVWELFWPLICGAQLVLARPGEQRDAEALAATMRAGGVTVAHFVPAMLSAFIASGQLRSIASLRAVVCSGEALPAGVRDRFLAQSKADLHNLYGPTEASIDVTHHTCARGERSTTVPIGRPIDGVGVHVLDRRLRPLPAGCEGEIFISGVALARGYLGQPRLTAEAFLPNPFGDGTRIYRTGDRGRLLGNGEVEFLGRRDGQVKVRGVRIELGEVESTLASLPGVERAAVVVGGERASPRLIGYFTGSRASPQGLRERLGERLPEQAVPGALIRLEAIPALANGKVDRGALAALAVPPPAAADAGEPPASTAELALARIWEEVLGVTGVRAGDNFFSLGGDSIRSIEVVARARSVGMRLATSEVFANPVLRELARKGEAAPRGGEESSRRGAFALVEPADRRLMPANVVDAVPLSSLMSGLVAESVENPHYCVYTTTLSIDGPYDGAVLAAAVSALVRRHPALRSTIEIARFSEPLQLVQRKLDVAVEEVDARGLSAAAWREGFDEWIAGERRRRFDWGSPPLVRFTVHRRDGDRWQLTMSEPFLDGWSATVVLSELLAAYRGDLEGRAVAVRSPRASNHDLVAAERAVSRSPEHRAFWRGYLAEAQPTALSRLAPPGEGLTAQLRKPVPISAEVSRGLLGLAEELDVPLKSVLIAAHARTMAALTGQEEVVCGLMVNGRPEEPDGERAVGLFLNTLPVRLRIDDCSWAELARAAYAAEAEILPWRRYPYARILHDGGGARLFDSVFNFTHFRPYAAFGRGSAVRLRSVEGSDQTYFPLTAQFSLDPAGTRVQLVLELNADAFAPLQVEELVDLHARALVAMARRKDARHVRESLVDPEWPRRGAGERPARTSRADGDRRLESLFAQRARDSPLATAVFGAKGRLSFDQVQAGASSLAGRVRDRCTVAPARVGICMEQSPAVLEAILAALTLGAAFVPLDSALPSPRLGALIDDAALDAVIADRTGALAIADAAAGERAGAIVTVDGGQDREGCAPASLAAGASAGDPALMIYTSGSTGLPKGVVSSHAAIASRLRWIWGAHPFRRGEVACVRGSLGFVDAITSLLAGVLAGVPTYVLPGEVREPDAIAAALGEAGVTRLTLVPAILQELLSGCSDEGLARLGGIHHWLLSGEPLAGDLVDRLRCVVPQATVLNLYGSTEVAGDVTAHECAGREPGMVPAGRAIDGTRVRVLDRWGRDVPRGTVGEVTVEGPGLALGYWGDARLTADRFRPAASGGGQRVFRSGDLGRQGFGGELEICGRSDRQVKVNGVRVEPAETEAVLASHPLVAACAVVPPRGEPGASPALVAFVELAGAVREAEGHDLSRALRAFLRAHLPSAMVPGRVTIVAALPRTASGKIARSSLAVGMPDGGEPAEPATPVARAIAQTWAEELGADAIGAGDDFFELGGDSLTAIRVLAELRRRLGVELTLRDLFDHPTAGDLALRLETKGDDAWNVAARR